SGHRLILKLGDPDSCRPRPHQDSHRKNVRRSNGIWESCSDTEHARMSQCLRRRVLALNGCMDVAEVLELALGNKFREAEIVLAEDFLARGVVGNATIGSQFYAPHFSGVTSKLDTFDRIWWNKSRIDIIKLDIEGHKKIFLEGGRETFAAYRPVLLIEVNRGHRVALGRGILSETAIP